MQMRRHPMQFARMSEVSHRCMYVCMLRVNCKTSRRRVAQRQLAT